MRYSLFFAILLMHSSLWAIDCESKKVLKEYKPRYAQLFSIRYYDQFKLVETKVKDSVDHFIVTDKKLDCTTGLPIFTSQAKRLIATSTTHLPFLSDFHLEDTLVGFPGVSYIVNPYYKNKKIKDIHYQMNPEELLSLRPDIVIAYSANLAGNKRLKELRQLTIPIVFNHDFEEKHPLARAEWMVFSSLFFGKDELAQELFRKIEGSYNVLKTQAKKLDKKKILVGDIQNGRWATCGGLSDLSLLISDAGGELLIKSSSHETQYLSLETILKLKESPDLWLSQNTWMDLSAMKKDSRYKKFSRVPLYNNVKKLNSGGFNDYWESGMARPDLLLKDLLVIIHPKLVPNTETIWYKELK